MFSNNGRFASGFEHFGVIHIVTVIICLLTVLILYLVRNRFKTTRSDAIFRYVVAIAMVGLELGFFVWSYYVKGGLNKDHIPLELCSIVMWATAYALIFDKANWIKVLMPWAVLGSVLAFVFSEMGGNYVFPHFRFIHFFGLHTLFLLGNVYYFFTKKIKEYRYKDIIKSYLILVIVAIIVGIFDYAFDYNYLFIKYLPGPAAAFHNIVDKPYHVIPAIALIFGVFNLIYLPFKENKKLA